MAASSHEAPSPQHLLRREAVTCACATGAEASTARRAGLRAVRIGIGGVNGLPEGELVSFGIAGGLNGLAAGTVIDATRVVDETGRVLWEGAPLGVAGAVQGTILASDRIVDDVADRAALHAATGADAVDLESGAIARSGRLAGCLRVVGDTPERPLAGLEAAVRRDGTTSPLGVARAFVRAPRASVRAARDARSALARLERVARPQPGPSGSEPQTPSRPAVVR